MPSMIRTSIRPPVDLPAPCGPVDRDFWTDADRPESALYLYKLIVAREASGRHLGTRVIDWMSRLAALEGRQWVRIDTWRTNTGLHTYYERLGFKHVRTEAPAHRRSGWLGQRPAGEMALPHDLLPVGPPQGHNRDVATLPQVPHQGTDTRADDGLTSENGMSP
ncbi:MULTISPECIES: N-acetyltransferase [unclassified Streptomyces]|uniref:GNAT family N-acetyltransferase n=1 Tax=unclassified Streptomyces TaxID=2593676 RepID=UPI0022593D58|nr:MULTISPECIES: GNAT family N-acetyltransferase [unclassified Streptomyces]WMD09793.1 hypothetical protein Q7C01_37995 [Streptomyces sp. FXY-T5]